MSAVVSPEGFRILMTELGIVVFIKHIPTIWVVPVALPTTVKACSTVFNTTHNCPGSDTLT